MRKRRRALVTGAAGFIGSNLFNRLQTLDDWEVFGCDDLSNGRWEFLTDASTVAHWCDFASDSVLNAVKRKQYDVVFHLAAVPRVSYSVEHPLETNETNVSKTLKLMDACVSNVKRLVFASSSSVYGGVEAGQATHEDSTLQPKSPYALQKLIIEQYLKLYSELYGLDSACLRFFNVFGPNQLGSSPYATAVSAWLSAIVDGRPMRSDGDGTQSRDMCYVDNVVDACIRAGSFDGELKGAPFNVACGESVTNNEIIDRLRLRFPAATVESAPWRAGDVMHTLADVSRAEQVLGYRPMVSFSDGLERTIEWAINEPLFRTLKLRV